MHYNKSNGKKYIGYTFSLLDRWHGNGQKYKTCPRFWSSIVHYGWDNFEHIVICKCKNKADANRMEQYYIELFDTTNPSCGYNMTKGGTGGNTHIGWTEERKQQYSQTCKKELEKRKKDSQYAQNLSKAQKKRWEKIRKGILQYPNHPTGGDVHNAKKVKCVETGKIYDCCADAVEELGYKRSKSSRISRVAQGYRKTFQGYHWEFVNEDK